MISMSHKETPTTSTTMLRTLMMRPNKTMETQRAKELLPRQISERKQRQMLALMSQSISLSRHPNKSKRTAELPSPSAWPPWEGIASEVCHP